MATVLRLGAILALRRRQDGAQPARQARRARAHLGGRHLVGSGGQRAGQRLAQLRDGREVRGPQWVGHRVGMGLALSLCGRGSAADICTQQGACCMAALQDDIFGSFVACNYVERAPGRCGLPVPLGSACLWGAQVTGGARAQDVPAQPGTRCGLSEHAGPHLRL